MGAASEPGEFVTGCFSLPSFQAFCRVCAGVRVRERVCACTCAHASPCTWAHPASEQHRPPAHRSRVTPPQCWPEAAPSLRLGGMWTGPHTPSRPASSSPQGRVSLNTPLSPRAACSRGDVCHRAGSCHGWPWSPLPWPSRRTELWLAAFHSLGPGTSCRARRGAGLTPSPGGLCWRQRQSEVRGPLTEHPPKSLILGGGETEA